MINKVTLIGNLGKDPEIRHFEGGSKVTKFSLATNENYQDRNNQWQTRTEWHDIVCWGSQAERAERTLKKGSLVYVDGKITHRKWQDQEGNDRRTTEIVSNYFRSLDRREGMDGAGQLAQGGNFPNIEEQFPKVEKPSISSAPALPEEDDLPF